MGKEKKERQLTEAEQRRTEEVNEIVHRMEADGYVRKDLTVSLLAANLIALALAVPFGLLFGGIFVVRNGLNFEITIPQCIAFVVLLFVLTIAHELLHGITWGLCVPEKFKAIEFGFVKEALTPYCACKSPLKKWQYLVGSVMPCLLLGILPAALAIVFDSAFWLVMGIVMILGAGGDLTVILKLVFHRSGAKNVAYLDHPSECGVILMEKE